MNEFETLQQLQCGKLTPVQATANFVALIKAGRHLDDHVLKDALKLLPFPQYMEIILACIENGYLSIDVQRGFDELSNSEFKQVVLPLINTWKGGLIEMFSSKILSLPEDDCYDILFAFVDKGKGLMLPQDLEPKLFSFTAEKRKQILILYFRYNRRIWWYDSRVAFFNLPLDELRQISWIYNRVCHLRPEDEELLKLDERSEEERNQLLYPPKPSSWDEATQNMIDVLHAGGYLYATEEEALLTRAPKDCRDKVLHVYHEMRAHFTKQTLETIQNFPPELRAELEQSTEYNDILQRSEQRVKAEEELLKGL